ncbi:metal dependent phosphohydrolase [Acidiphilium sp. CAG:727]|nr:metal dependent phosphohydrolase [Acidiphilium sp. CAG:727]
MKEEFDFYAYLMRMKYIKRWALMRSTSEENIMEHSWEVAVIAHALAIIKNEKFGGSVDEYKTLCLAVYHETSEVVTGDLPTPIKYFNREINSAYKSLERDANERLIAKLPEELQNRYREFILDDPSSEEHKLMKYADRICAYIKCLEEMKVGNKEFLKAKESIGKELSNADDEAVKYFIKNVLPTFSKTLDELEM